MMNYHAIVIKKLIWGAFLIANAKVNALYTSTNGPGDRSSIPGRVIPKTQKMVLDAALLSTQHYKVKIKTKVEQCRERSSTLSYTSV